MSGPRVTAGYISLKGFAHLPKIGDSVPGVSQPRSSLDSGSVSSRFSGISSRRAAQLEEGDLITGTIDITHERAYMLPAIRDEDCAEERKALEEFIVFLGIIPPAYREGWTLDDDSNSTWLSLHLHRHHETYATFLIAPSAWDSGCIRDNLERDNSRRIDIIKTGGTDPGRDSNADWFEGTKGEYELVILHPAHFLIGGFPVVIKHPDTQKITCFYASKNGDGHLREGSPTGLPLPPFRSRGKIGRDVPLNPILVNFAAHTRLRRLIRQDPMWGSTLNPRVIEVLQRVVKLHSAVLWNPQGSREAQFIIEDPSSEPPLARDLRDWPYHRASSRAPRPSHSAPVQDSGKFDINRYFDLIAAQFEDLPDLGGAS